MEKPIRIDLVISGKVQGVGYRYFIKKKAESLGIKGSVRNEKNGSVIITVQGQQHAIESMLRWCHKGTRGSIIKHVDKTPKPIENLVDFRIVY